jgi:Domain of unknown function (DUF4177)
LVWEYKVIYVPFTTGQTYTPLEINLQRLTATLNKAGAEGWEAVCAMDSGGGDGAARTVLMKRPISN